MRVPNLLWVRWGIHWTLCEESACGELLVPVKWGARPRRRVLR